MESNHFYLNPIKLLFPLSENPFERLYGGFPMPLGPMPGGMPPFPFPAQPQPQPQQPASTSTQATGTVNQSVTQLFSQSVSQDYKTYA